MEYPKQILSKEFKTFKRALEKVNECAGKGEISLEVFETRLRNITTKLKQLIEVITLIMTDEEIELYLLPVLEFSKFEKEVETTLEILGLTGGENVIFKTNYKPIRESDCKYPNEVVRIFSLDLGCEIPHYLK